MKKNRSFIAIFVVILISSFCSISGVQAKKQKMSPIFYQDVIHSSAQVPVVIEFTNPCSYRYYTDHSFHFFSLQGQSESKEQYRNHLIQQQDRFILGWQEDGISILPEMHITAVMNAITARVRGKDIPQLLNNPNIKFIYDNSLQFYPERSVAAYTTQVQQLRDQYGWTGKGITVGVIDSGLDRTHQDFSKTISDAETTGQDGYVLQTRVLHGEDFSDGDMDWHDDLPADMHGYGHGTHVAGIIGGNSYFHADSKGMAPEVEFNIYKVFTKTKSGARNVLAAIDRAFTDGCDIINMSLGHMGGSAKGSSYFTALTENLQEAIQEGKFLVVASAGNDGTRGRKLNFSTGSPASTFEFLSVAASNDRPFETFVATLPEEVRDIDYSLSAHCGPFTNALLENELVLCGIGKPEEIPEEVMGKIAFIERGELSFREKMDNAIEKGAIAVILYNHSAGRVIPSLLRDGEDPSAVKTVPVCMVAKTDGLWLLKNREQYSSLVLKEGRQMTIATFSSSGPTTDGYFKPEITAPGTAILSCFPVNSYQKAGGTSMSSPVVAGLAAVMKEVHPEWSLRQIKSAFMNTAEILVNPLTNHPISFSMQGAGEARLDKALQTPAFIEPQALLVQSNQIQPGDLSPKDPIQFTVQSNSDKTIQYTLSTEFVSLLPQETIPVICSIEPNCILLNPGEEATFTIRFSSFPETTPRDHYDGLLWLHSPDEQSLHIPMIVYPHSIGKIESAVSNISVEPKQWSFSDEEPKELTVGFYLHSGTEQNIDGEINYNNFANVLVSLVDELGQEWALIDTPASLMAGDYYSFTWNGKTKNNQYSLFDGLYYLRIVIDGITYKGGVSSFENTYDSFSEDREQCAFEVTNSPVSQPQNLVISANRLYKVGDIMTLDFILEDSPATNGIGFTYRYNSAALQLKDIRLGTDMKVSPLQEMKIDHDIDHGILTCSLVQPDQIWNQLQLRVLSIDFVVMESGQSLIFSLNDGFLYRNGKEAGRIKAFYPEVKGTKRSSYLLSDLNNDKKVDKYDLIEFNKCFGTFYGETLYQENCDFNQDHRIDARDYFILGSEYED